MRSKLAAALVAASLLSPVIARADAIDMSTVTCETLLTMDEQAITFMLTWVAGYIAGLNDETSMDPAILGKATEDTVKYCQENKEMSVVNAAKAIEDE